MAFLTTVGCVSVGESFQLLDDIRKGVKRRFRRLGPDECPSEPAELMDPISGYIEPTHQDKITVRCWENQDLYSVDCTLYAEYVIEKK